MNLAGFMLLAQDIEIKIKIPTNRLKESKTTNRYNYMYSHLTEDDPEWFEIFGKLFDTGDLRPSLNGPRPKIQKIDFNDIIPYEQTPGSCSLHCSSDPCITLFE